MTSKRAVRRNLAPNVFEAFRRVVFRYDVPDMASAMGMKPGVLYNKADGDEDTRHQPTLRDVVLATQISGDFEIIDALNEMFGRAVYDCSQHEQASDEALLELLASLGKENGEFHAALADGLKAKRFTLDTMRRIRGEAYDVVGALMTLVSRLEGYLDDSDAAAD